MPSDLFPSRTDSGDQTWSEIELLIDEQAQLAQLPTPKREFFEALLRRLTQATGAIACAVWSCAPHQDPQVEFEVGHWPSNHENRATPAWRSRNLIRARHVRQTQAVLPNATTLGGENPTEYPLVIHPCWLDDNPVTLLEIVLNDDASPAELKNIEHLVAVFGDLIVDYHRHRLLSDLRHREGRWLDLEHFIERVHGSLDVAGTSFAIANEAARITGCERVVVLHGSESNFRVAAINGLSMFDRRSPPIRELEALVRAIVKTQEPLWFPADEHDRPPELKRLLHTYLDASSAQSVALVPLTGGTAAMRGVVGVISFERFDSTPWSDTQRGLIETICRHSTLALRHACDVAGLPLLGVSRLLQGLAWCVRLRQLPKTLMIVLAVTSLVAVFAVVPAELQIRAQGELVPQRYRHVFAPAEGVVEQLYVDHSMAVEAGQVLFELRRPHLDYEQSRVLGELQTNQKRLDSVRSARLNYTRRDATNAHQFDELTSEEERLKTLVASLEAQRSILASEQDQLTVRSPIDGEIVTWKLEENLTARPVRRGELLLSVADPHGPWHLEMRIADYDIQHVLSAREQTPEVPVSFIVASQPGHVIHGVITRVAMSTELDDQQRPSVLITVAFDKEQLRALRPGATVMAKIHCGRSALGYVWFRELFDVLRTRLLF